MKCPKCDDEVKEIQAKHFYCKRCETIWLEIRIEKNRNKKEETICLVQVVKDPTKPVETIAVKRIGRVECSICGKTSEIDRAIIKPNGDEVIPLKCGHMVIIPKSER